MRRCRAAARQGILSGALAGPASIVSLECGIERRPRHPLPDPRDIGRPHRLRTRRCVAGLTSIVSSSLQTISEGRAAGRAMRAHHLGRRGESRSASPAVTTNASCPTVIQTTLAAPALRRHVRQKQTFASIGRPWKDVANLAAQAAVPSGYQAYRRAHGPWSCSFPNGKPRPGQLREGPRAVGEGGLAAVSSRASPPPSSRRRCARGHPAGSTGRSRSRPPRAGRRPARGRGPRPTAASPSGQRRTRVALKWARQVLWRRAGGLASSISDLVHRAGEVLGGAGEAGRVDAGRALQGLDAEPGIVGEGGQARRLHRRPRP